MLVGIGYIDNYVNVLKYKFNIETIFQLPRSPYTNVLDLWSVVCTPSTSGEGTLRQVLQSQCIIKVG